MSEKLYTSVRDLLAHLGQNPHREGLLDTPRRWISAMQEMTQGYRVDVAALLSVTFDSGAYDQIIAVKQIPFTSVCEHHLLPFTGTAGVAYLPSQDQDGRYHVVGLSKIPRVVDAFAQRLQLQEQLTSQIAQAFVDHVEPRGVAVMMRAEHSCASCRGVRKSGMVMVTSDMRGVFRKYPSARAEVLRILE